MARKKIINKEIEEKIINILEEENRSMSIREIRKILKEYYHIQRSPQIIKRHLEFLRNKNKIFEE